MVFRSVRGRSSPPPVAAGVVSPLARWMRRFTGRVSPRAVFGC